MTSRRDAKDAALFGHALLSVADEADALASATAEPHQPDRVTAPHAVYRFRGGNRHTQFLSGDHSLWLVTKTDRPGIALPDLDTE